MRAVALALLGLAWAAPVAAAPSEADIVAAETLLDEGFAHFEAGRYVQAASAFERAHARVPDPLNLRNIGRAYEKAERPGLALQWLDRHLASTDRPDRLERSRADRTRIAAAYLGLLALSCTPPAEVRVQRIGPGVVEVAALGRWIECPTRLELEPGRYEIDARAAEHAETTRLVAVASADVTEASIELLSLTSPTPPAAPSRAAPIAVLISGGVLVVAGGALHAANAASFGDLESDPGNAGLRDTVDGTALGALAGYSLGGALLVGGLVWYLLVDGAPAPAPAANGAPRVALPW